MLLGDVAGAEQRASVLGRRRRPRRGDRGGERGELLDPPPGEVRPAGTVGRVQPVERSRSSDCRMSDAPEVVQRPVDVGCGRGEDTLGPLRHVCARAGGDAGSGRRGGRRASTVLVTGGIVKPHGPRPGRAGVLTAQFPSWVASSAVRQVGDNPADEAAAVPAGVFDDEPGGTDKCFRFAGQVLSEPRNGPAFEQPLCSGYHR